MKLASLALCAFPALVSGPGAQEVLPLPLEDAPGLVELRALRDPEASATEQAERIAALGPCALRTVLEAFARGHLVEGADAPRQTLSAVQEQAARLAIEAFDGSTALGAAEMLLEDASLEVSGRRLAWLEVVALKGDIGDLKKVIRWVIDLEMVQEASLSRRLRDSLRRAFTGVLARDGEALGVAQASWQRFGEGGLRALVEALGDLPDARGVELLGNVLQWRADMASLVLTRLTLAGHGAPSAVADEASIRVLPFLDESRVDLCRSAVLALGSLGSPIGVEGLIELLESPDRGLRQAAHQALRAASFAQLPADPGSWRRWLTFERAWDVESALDRIERLRGASGMSAAALMREVSQHSLHRSRVGAALLSQLPGLDEPLRGLALGALKSLGMEPSAP